MKSGNMHFKLKNLLVLKSLIADNTIENNIILIIMEENLIIMSILERRIMGIRPCKLFDPLHRYVVIDI